MKLYIKALLMLGSLLSITRACSPGCIRCDLTTNTCSVCNFLKNYLPDGSGGCELSPIEGCLRTNAKGGCYRCDDGRYYDSNTNSCIIPTTITNCRLYSAPTTCSICATNFYLVNNTCVQLTTQQIVVNCFNQTAPGVCSTCNRRYVRSQAKNSCIDISNDKCSNYRYYFCNRCDITTSLNNKNSYLIKPFSDNDNSLIEDVISDLRRGFTDTLIASFCMPTSVSNCKIFESYNKCDTCNDGHYLTENKTCQAYTTNDLNGCVSFASETECLACSNGYYINETECIVSTNVDNCETYSSTQDSCIACSTNYYLNAGSCTERENLVENCSTFTIDVDTCATCGDGYEIDSEGLVCIDLPVNCTAYQSYDLENNAVNCATCASEYYLLDGECFEGLVENCDAYAYGGDTCVKCIDNYGLSEGTCELYDVSVENCETYLSDLPTRCETCTFDSKLFYQTSICNQLAEIPGCNSFSNTETCDECNLGYELVEGTCAKIPEEENCLRKSEGDCVRCTDSYELIENVCTLIPAFKTDNCAQPNVDSLGVDYKCDGCNSGYLPIKNIIDLCVDKDLQSFSLIDNCKKYNDDDGNVICILCDSGYTLSSDNSSCLEECPEGQVKYLGYLDIHENSTAHVSAAAKCFDIDHFDDLPGGCEVASHELRTDANVCLKCAEGYIPIESCTLDNTYFNIYDLNSFKEGQAFSVISCAEQNDSTVFVPSSLSPDEFCKYYYPIGNKYYCKECKFGMKSVIEVDGQGNYYVNCTEVDEACDSDYVLGSGFSDDSWISDMYGFNLAYKFTCHKCIDPDQIPFIHLSKSGDLINYQLNLEDDIPSEATTLDGDLTVCRKPTAEGLFVNQESFSGFVDNCALGLIVVNATKQVSAISSSVRCLACKDGYTPSYNSSGFYIQSCDIIENCNLDSPEGLSNGCRYCADGYAKQLNADGSINTSSCSAIAVSNCEVYDVENDTCSICKKGHIIDYDGNCTEITLPFCVNVAQRTTLSTKLADSLTNYSYVYHYGLFSFDCYNCEEGYVALNVETDDSVCSLYPDLETKGSDENSNFIENCSMYHLNEEDALRCGDCTESFIINQTHDFCYNNEGFIGCKTTVENGSGCYECEDNYLIINDSCAEQNIEKCVSYKTDGSDLLCETCDSGYFLSTNECIAGEIDNCDSFSAINVCSRCKSGHYLFLNLCLEIPENYNCNDAITSTDGNTHFICNSCVDGYLMNTEITSADYPVCLQGPLIEHCANYDDNFACQYCENNYYFSDGVCNKRTVIVDDCGLYNKFADECTICIDNYVLNGDECALVLNNIPFCLQYTSENTCSLCSDDKYLFNNECFNVPSANLVENCKYYSDEDSCSECEEGYFFKDNVCSEIVALNCLNYVNQNVCGTCSSNSYLKTRADSDIYTRDCILKEIDNCFEINMFSGKCKTCDEGYFKSSGACSEVTSLIDNCKVYENATTCSICESGYIRSINKLFCTYDEAVATFEPNCTDLRYSSTKICTACKAGNYFNSNECVSCSSNSTSDGCMHCNPSDNSNCLICTADYYMNTSGNCVSSVAGLEGDYDDDDESIKISSIIGLIFALTLFLLQ